MPPTKAAEGIMGFWIRQPGDHSLSALDP